MHRFPRQDRGGVNDGRPSNPKPVSGFAAATTDLPRRWRWQCRDLAHRRQELGAHRRNDLSVLVNRDRVVLAGPPGDTVVLRADGVGRLTSALRDAAEQARK